MPLLVILLSVLGLMPFVGCGLAALGPDPATSARMLSALIGYAAVMLAFAGGVHWGFELQSRSRTRSCSAHGSGSASCRSWWAGLRCCCHWWSASWLSLVLLIAAYIGAVLVEHEAARRDLLPPRYLWLRWGFTRGRRLR